MKRLNELTPEQLRTGMFLRVSVDGATAVARCDDLDASVALFSGKRDGDKWYVMPRPPTLERLMLSMRPEVLFDVGPHGMGAPFLRTAWAPEPEETPAQLEEHLLRAVRELRGEMGIELDTHRHDIPDDMIEPLDDSSDRYAQMELDDDKESR